VPHFNHVSGEIHTEHFSVFFKKKIIFIYLFLAVLGLRSCTGFPVVAASRGCSLVAELGLLVAVAFLVAGLGL